MDISKRLCNTAIEAADSKRVIKTGYLRGAAGLTASECDTVASHIQAVNIPTLLLGYELQDLIQELGLTIDMCRLAFMSVFHDAGETRSGDTGSNSMAVFGSCKLHHLESQGLAAFTEGWLAQKLIMDLYDEYRGYSSVEALLVHTADIIEGLEKGLQTGHCKPWLIDGMLLPILASNINIFRRREGDLAELGKVLAEIILDTAVELFERYRVRVEVCDSVETIIKEKSIQIE